METGAELTPMKLLKLVYISHGWYLGLTESALIPEVVEAWKYGPVIPSVYHEFKSFGNDQITSLASEFVGRNRVFPLPDDEQTELFLDKIWEIYGRYNGLQLSSMTHQEGTPWDIVWNKNGGSSDAAVRIPNEIIEQHYKEKLNEPSAKA